MHHTWHRVTHNVTCMLHLIRCKLVTWETWFLQQPNIKMVCLLPSTFPATNLVRDGMKALSEYGYRSRTEKHGPSWTQEQFFLPSRTLSLSSEMFLLSAVCFCSLSNRYRESFPSNFTPTDFLKELLDKGSPLVLHSIKTLTVLGFFKQALDQQVL